MGYSKSVERLNPNAHSLSSKGRDASLQRRVAHAIHAQSLRQEETFVEVNCAAIPEDLIES